METKEPSRVEERVAVARAGAENLRPDELADELRSGTTVLIDVRGPEECRAGVIPGAMQVPRGLLEFSGAPEVDPGRRVVLYCADGARSALAVETLYRLGFVDVAHLDGGIVAWARAGLPVLSPTEPRPDGSAAAE